MANNENEKKENLTIEEMEQKLKAIEEQRLYYNECIKQQKIAQEKSRQTELRVTKEARKTELDAAITRANKLLAAWCKDYGKYTINSNDDILSVFWPHNLYF